MHRTQLLLKDWHYETLRDRAEQEGISISAYVRKLLDQQLSRKKNSKAKLASIRGLVSDKKISAEEHDHYLYGEHR